MKKYFVFSHLDDNIFSNYSGPRKNLKNQSNVIYNCKIKLKKTVILSISKERES